MKTEKHLLSLNLIYLVFILIIQFIPSLWAIFSVVILLAPPLFLKKYKLFMLCLCSFVGHIFWLGFSSFVNTNFENNHVITVISRLGLLGYLLVFYLWQKIQPTDNNNFALGNLQSTIKMPFIYYGKVETISRFLMIFLSLWLIPIGITIFTKRLPPSLLLWGFLFSIINSFLEELIWRGFILSRLTELMNERIALLVGSLAFGFYHISIGFSLPVCLVFAIGGIFFNGASIRSKGLLAPVLMHFVVNLFFVVTGLVF